MKIVIKNTTGSDLNPFIHKVVLPYMYRLIVSNMDRDILRLYKPDVLENIRYMLFHRDYLQCMKSPDGQYTISIDENKIVGKSSAKLCDICNMINFGSFDYPATHVFTKVFHYVQANFWRLYKLYHQGGVYY